MQGTNVPQASSTRFPGLEQIGATFPNAVFPYGAIHEFLTDEPEYAAACGGFLGGLLKVLMQQGGICNMDQYIPLFPPALKRFGGNLTVIFIDLKRERDILWAIGRSVEMQLPCSCN